MPRSSKSYKMTCAYNSAVSDDQRLIACVGGQVNVFDIERREKVASFRPFPHLIHAAFSPNGRFIAVKNTLGRIAVFNIATSELLCDHKNQKEGEGCQVSFSPDGETLIDGSWDGLATVRKAFEPAVIWRKEFPGEMIGAISHDLSRRKWLFQHSGVVQPEKGCRDRHSLILREWPFKNDALQRSWIGQDTSFATLSPDGSRVCLVNSQGRPKIKLQVIRVTDEQIIASIPANRVREISWSADCEVIGTAQGYDDKSKFTFYRSSDLSIVGEVPCQYPSSICYLANSDQVVLGSWQFSRLARLEDFLSGEVKMRK
jgi:WD40 repeat protein